MTECLLRSPARFSLSTTAGFVHMSSGSLVPQRKHTCMRGDGSVYRVAEEIMYSACSRGTPKEHHLLLHVKTCFSYDPSFYPSVMFVIIA